jgi:transposase
MLLEFAAERDRAPGCPDDVAPAPEPVEELRRVRLRKDRRNLAHFENLPVTTRTYELSASERACSCCGSQRQEVGADESWQIEYYPGHFERIHHIRKKYACPGCDSDGQSPQMETAAKPAAPARQGAGRAGAAGLHRHQQVQRLPAAVPAGRHLRAAGI